MGDRMRLGFLLHGTIEICSCLTQRGMGRYEPVRYTAQHCIALPCIGELVSETLTLPTFPDTCQTDAEGLEEFPGYGPRDPCAG